MEFQPAGPWQVPQSEAGEGRPNPFRDGLNFLRGHKQDSFTSAAFSGCLPAIIKTSTVIVLAMLVTAGLKIVVGASGMASTGGGLLILALAALILHGKAK